LFPPCKVLRGVQEPGALPDLRAKGQGRRLQGAFGRKIRSFFCGGLKGSGGPRGSCSQTPRRYATLSQAASPVSNSACMSGATRVLVSVTMQQTWGALSAARVIWFYSPRSSFLKPLRLPRNHPLPLRARELPQLINTGSIWFFRLKMPAHLHDWIGWVRAWRS